MKFIRLSALAVALASAEIPKPSDAPAPLPPEQSAAAFKLPEGFRMELVASEPLIASPSAVCWDARGRMLLSELHGYNLEGQLDIEELNKTGQLDTQVRRIQADEKFKRAALSGTYGVVKMLHDTDGDGRMDKADVWATNLPPAYGLVPARGGVIVACAPDIVFLADRDGDGTAEVRETLFTGFRTGALERGINSPQWGPDGWIYCARGWGGGEIRGLKLAQAVKVPDSDFRFRPDGSAIEPVTGRTHTFGFAMSQTGDRFVMSTATPGIFVAPLPWRYLARNPDAVFSSLSIETGDRRVYPLAPPHPWRTKRAEHPGFSKYYRDRYGAGDSDASGWFTSACGPLIYQDPVLPGLQGQYFVCEPAGNLIHRAIIVEEGTLLKLRRAQGEERSEFAASRDAWSHPISLTHGPDGSIWVVDYYREIIEDYSAIPRYLQQQYGLYAGHDRGRIYRLTHRQAPPPPGANMAALDAAALARECDSLLHWRRQTAHRLLTERGDKSVAARLRELLPHMQPSGVITALRTLDALDTLGPDDLRPFLDHTNAAVAVHALQLAERGLHRSGSGLLEAALDACSAKNLHPRVQIQCALSLGETDAPRALAFLAQCVRERLGVRWMDAAVLSSLHGRGEAILAELVRDIGGGEAFLSSLAQSIAAHGHEPEVATSLGLIETAAPSIQAAVLDGLRAGRKNAPPIASPSARAALAALTASPSSKVAAAARALEDTFLPMVADSGSEAPVIPPMENVSPETFQRYVVALAGARELARGAEVFRQACALCHRVADEGFAMGPDITAQLGMSDESLLQDILMPNARIRPGFETAVVQSQTAGGTTQTIGILKDEGATTLTVSLPGGVEQVFLRKDLVHVRRVSSSLMPSFAEGLTPKEVADLLAWLRERARK